MTSSTNLAPEQCRQIWLGIFLKYHAFYKSLPQNVADWNLGAPNYSPDVLEAFLTQAIKQKQLQPNPKANNYLVKESQRFPLTQLLWPQLKSRLTLSLNAQSLADYLIQTSDAKGQTPYQKSTWAKGCCKTQNAIESSLKELRRKGVGCITNGGKHFTLTNKTDLILWLDSQPKPEPIALPETEFKPTVELTAILEPGLRPKELSKPVQILLHPTSTTPPLLSSAGVTYFVDTENANNASFYQGLKHLKPSDEVVLMMTQNTRIFGQASLLHCLLSECPATISTYYSEVSGHNALDFVLISQLTLRLTKNPTGCLRIISADKGFMAALEHLTGVLALKPGQIGLQSSFQSLKVA